jgi:hypothetical protein
MSVTLIHSHVGLALLALFTLVLCTGVIGHCFDPCNAVAFPDVGGALSVSDCYEILSAAVKSADKDKQAAAAELVNFFTAVVRIEGALLLAMGITCLYTMSIPFEQRHPALFMMGTAAVLAGLVDASHAGLVPFGSNGMVTINGQAGGIALTGFWAIIGLCAWSGFFGSRAAAKAKGKAD